MAARPARHRVLPPNATIGSYEWTYHFGFGYASTAVLTERATLGRRTWSGGHMQISHQQVEVLWNALEVSSFHPPREAVAALFALAAPTDPRNVLVSAAWADPARHSGTVTWTLLALAADGLAVVTASAPQQWDWASERHKGSPEGRRVDAHWIRLDDVRGLAVNVGDVASSSSNRNDRGLRYWEAWTLQLAGRPPLELTAADHSTASPARLRTFVERLRSALVSTLPERTPSPTSGPEAVVALQRPDA